MRCKQCGYDNPENHRFCGMCGAKLERAVSPVAINDEDPLDLQAPAYRFEDRSRSGAEPPGAFRDRNRERERMRDLDARNHPAKRTGNFSSISVKTLPQDTVEEEAVEKRQSEKAPARATGIGGPSFLGLGYEGTNTGFVYDKPRNDGFVYDTDGQSPEYLLEEVPRGISWRAWALMLLLIAGAGLGYIQWRASHNEGPDIGTILARNGLTLDPNHPVITPENKPPAQKPDATAPQAANNDSDQGDATQAKSPEEQANASGQDANNKSANSTASNNDSANSKAASSKSGEQEEENVANQSSAAAAKTSDANKKTDENASPESDGPAAASKHNTNKEAALAEEKPAQPKSLGDKDPLIIQAEKYLQGRGVRKNCSTGVNLLRQAVSAGNPEADVKMGALYWSGTCVTHSNVTAYEWFSRAHGLEPQNRWIERSRNSLWASMSPEERRQASY